MGNRNSTKRTEPTLPVLSSGQTLLPTKTDYWSQVAMSVNCVTPPVQEPIASPEEKYMRNGRFDATLYIQDNVKNPNNFYGRCLEYYYTQLIVNSKDTLQKLVEAYGTGKTEYFFRLPQQIISLYSKDEVLGTLNRICDSKQFKQAIKDTYGDNFTVIPSYKTVVNPTHYGIDLRWTNPSKTYELE